MAAKMNLLFALSLCMLPLFAYGDTCLAPQVTTQTYTTTESIVSFNTVFILEFTLSCKNNLKNINLYADVAGRTIPATKTSEPNKYQISLTDEPKKLPSGTYEVRFFDEEGFAQLRKAQRSGDATDSLKPLFTVNLSHSGIWSGPLIQSEFVAAMTAIIVWWLAYTQRGKLLA